MPKSLDDFYQKFIDDVGERDLCSNESTTAINNLKTFAEAKKLLDPDPIPDPEPTGVKAFFGRHAGDLIKVGGTLSAVALIGVFEAKGDVIFRSKASKYL